MYDLIKECITPELLVLIPVLYILGVGIKKSDLIANKYIPITLGLSSIGLALLYTLGSISFENTQVVIAGIFTAIVQGLLCAGASVYVNQLIKQQAKGDIE